MLLTIPQRVTVPLYYSANESESEFFTLIFVAARCKQMQTLNWILYEPIRSDVTFAFALI